MIGLSDIFLEHCVGAEYCLLASDTDECTPQTSRAAAAATGRVRTKALLVRTKRAESPGRPFGEVVGHIAQLAVELAVGARVGFL